MFCDLLKILWVFVFFNDFVDNSSNSSLFPEAKFKKIFYYRISVFGEHAVYSMIHFIVLELFEVNNQLDSNYSTTNNSGYLLSLEHFITILLI